MSTVEAWRQTYASASGAWRTSATFGRDPGAVAAWWRRAEVEGQNVRIAPWNARAVHGALPDMRALATVTDPGVFVPTLAATCAALGVAVVFVPTPPGCPASGCTRWITPE